MKPAAMDTPLIVSSLFCCVIFFFFCRGGVLWVPFFDDKITLPPPPLHSHGDSVAGQAAATTDPNYRPARTIQFRRRPPCRRDCQCIRCICFRFWLRRQRLNLRWQAVTERLAALRRNQAARSAIAGK